MYSLIATAKMNDVDPQAWLADVLARIAGHPAQTLTIVDTFTRLSPAIDARSSYRGADVVATLEHAAHEIG